jgi:hypothetical protein
VEPFDSPLYICIPPTTFHGGKRICGGALRINDNPCGNYEFNQMSLLIEIKYIF